MSELESSTFFKKIFKNQLKAVTRRLSAKIQSNQSAYLKHLCEIELLHDRLADSTAIVSHCRKSVSDLKSETKRPIEVISRSRTRKRLSDVREILYGLKTLIQLEETLNELLRRSDYTEAIKLMQNCRNIGKVEIELILNSSSDLKLYSIEMT